MTCPCLACRSAEEVASIEKPFEKNDKFDNTSVKDFRMQGVRSKSGLE